MDSSVSLSRSFSSLRRGVFKLDDVALGTDADGPDWCDVLDTENRPVLLEREILRSMQVIVSDADQIPVYEVGVLTSALEVLGYSRSGSVGLNFYWRALHQEPQGVVDSLEDADQQQEQRAVSECH